MSLVMKSKIGVCGCRIQNWCLWLLSSQLVSLTMELEISVFGYEVKNWSLRL